ncbi:hypothetical protein QQS21_006306 [Conoideocrella luteorostrata]|uniref:alpha-galactosidase n=1 Tax=Conoideocrella luteorostrata TaxID=1105319 RepID=A0AAJ0CQL7_9HYPO|nr:hypothetical protein QQS21_006306 [Conoideocrella luteorostrata]
MDLAKPCALGKKLAITGIILTVAITLNVGLGVGLTHRYNDKTATLSVTPSTEPVTTNSTASIRTLWHPHVNSSRQIILRQPIDISNGPPIPNENIWDINMLTKTDTVDYLKFLRGEASKYNILIELKNAENIIPDAIIFVDFSVNEQCVQMIECEMFAAFIRAGKPVFNIEYPDGASRVSDDRTKEICLHDGVSKGPGWFSRVLKEMGLDAWVRYSVGRVYDTKIRGSS